MKFSIIGTGFIFPRHLEAIKSVGGEIVGLDTNEDCVVVLTPNDSHYKYCKKYAEQGKIVLCEKPLVIKSKHAKELAKYYNIFSVLQLRYHPLIPEMKKYLKDKNKIELEIMVYRDDKYFNGWKGEDRRSGGIIFNLGIHYFDLAYYLDPNAEVSHKLSVNEPKETQQRIIRINGKEFNLSSKDNLSQENLHKYVYEDLIKGKGVRAKDLIELICKMESLQQ